MESLTKPVHRFPWLDLLRGLAAMEVFLAHTRTLFFGSFLTGKKSLLKSIFYYSTGFSYQAVIVFFVLSGFFISRKVHFPAMAGEFSAKQYSIDRLTRLWIVLIPALLLTLVADKIGLYLYPNLPAYQGATAHAGLDKADINPLGGLDFLGNVFFLQNILVKPFGTNTSLWSLCNEFWYYVLFPMAYFVFIARKIRIKILLGALLMAVMFFIGVSICLYGLVWLLGFGVVLLQQKFPKPSATMIGLILIPSLVVMAILLNYTRTGGAFSFWYDMAVGVSTALIIYCLLHVRMVNILKRVSSFLSEISYSLYAIHLPLVIMLSAWLFRKRMDWNIHSIFVYTGAVTGILLFTICWWFLFESRYKQVRSFIKKKLPAKQVLNSL